MKVLNKTRGVKHIGKSIILPGAAGDIPDDVLSNKRQMKNIDRDIQAGNLELVEDEEAEARNAELAKKAEAERKAAAKAKAETKAG